MRKCKYCMLFFCIGVTECSFIFIISLRPDMKIFLVYVRLVMLMAYCGDVCCFLNEIVKECMVSGYPILFYIA